MLQEHGASENQVYLLDPVRDATADEAGTVTVSFDLDVR